MINEVFLQRLTQEGIATMFFGVYLFISTRREQKREDRYLDILEKMVDREREKNETKNNI